MRPDVTLIGLTTNIKVARQNILTWGTFMDVVDEISSSTEMVDRACRVAKTRKILKMGKKLLLLQEFLLVKLEQPTP
jgi:pyruvate kinase